MEKINQENIQSILELIAKTYFNFLNSIEWQDQFFIEGISEGKRKFLSNLWIAYFKKLGLSKYEATQFISKDALEILNTNKNKNKGLVFEHIFPKANFQTRLEDMAKEKYLSESIIFDTLKNYWFLATITSSEDEFLKRTSKGKIGFDRYKIAEIELLSNPFFLKTIKESKHVI